MNGSSEKNDGVANLPFARGAIFHCLDDYLAHLRANGAIDLPWWREITRRLRTRRTHDRRHREIATRADLMQRFGFRR